MAPESSSLIELRKQHGLTADQVAARLGLDQSTIIRAEQSEAKRVVSIQTLDKVAAAMGYRLEYRFVAKEKADHPQNDLDRIRKFTPVERLSRSLELSELAKELKNAPRRSY